MTLMTSANALACACGCGMFDIGLPGLGMPTGSGGSLNLQDTFLSQGVAKQGEGQIPLAKSADQRIQSNFVNANFQYNFDHDWGMMAMVPYWQRNFSTNLATGGGVPDVVGYHTNALSDIRVMGMYTGLVADMSVGLIGGLKLPTGQFSVAGFDRDTAPGTGTTDLLLGGYWVGQQRFWGWYVQGMFRSAMDSRDGYRPGDSLQLVAGVHYDALSGIPDLTPLLQFNWTARQRDSGSASDPANSGLQSLYLTPGFLYNLSRQWQANGLLYLPVFQSVNGIQLVPRQIVSVGLTYLF